MNLSAVRKKQGLEISKETLFSALADRTRLRIVNLMSDGEICVCFFVEILGESQPKISRHLAYLRRTGLVGARRDGKWMHYRLVEPQDADGAAALRSIVAWLRNDPEMVEDRAKLANVCCATELPAAIQGAPMPIGIKLPQDRAAQQRNAVG